MRSNVTAVTAAAPNPIVAFRISVVPPKIGRIRLNPELANRGGDHGLMFPPVTAATIGSARAAVFARRDLGGDRPPWDGLAVWQLPFRGVAVPCAGPSRRVVVAVADGKASS